MADPNKLGSLLKDAILRAAEAVGEDKEGKGGLTGYCMFLAKEEPRAFASLLGRALPTEVSGSMAHQIDADPLSDLLRQVAEHGKKITDCRKEEHHDG